MRSFLLLAFLAFFTAQVANGQGLEGIIVERFYVSDAADEANSIAQGAIAPLPVGSVTYRVYVDMASGYKYSQIYGSETHNLIVNTTTSFYNDPNFGVAVNPGSTSVNLTRRHTTMIDSWFTAGGTCVGKVGVMEEEDNDGTIGNQQNILANNPGGCYGLPINGTGAQDGMLPSSAATYVAPNTLGLGTALDVLDQTFGNSIVINNGTIVPLGGVVGPTASNRVLIAQFTTSGTLSFEFNVQLINISTGLAENYVASNPVGDELTHPTLTFISGQAPAVSITAPANNAVVPVGTAIQINANASDNGGIVEQVEFYVDGVLLFTDNTAPFSANYTPTPGAHTISAIAFDNDCLSTTSSVINISAQSNNPPTVTVSAPTSAIVGTSITISATASDTDGSVTQVEFFVNNVSVGIDNSAPYSIQYTTTLGSEQIIRAVATDNQGATANSNNVILNVVANIPPSVVLTNPTNGAAFIAPQVITITANANDSDGNVSQVSFFVDGNLIGTDNMAPYSFAWTSEVGEHIITASATDNLGATTISSLITISVADPNALPYYIDDVIVDCSEELVCVPVGVSITSPVTDVIGFDFEFTYNPDNLQPSGIFEVYSNLIDAEIVSLTYNVINPGVLSVSLSLNGNAQAGAGFNGFGDLFCISFINQLNANESSEIAYQLIQESYTSGVELMSGSEGSVSSIINAEYNSQLTYWANNNPISYDALNPNDFLITDIFGVFEGSINGDAEQPNVDGLFSYDLNNGTSIQIERQIQNNVAVQSVVNAADAVIAKTIVADVAYNPNVYQMIAMDVNLDGVVSAGDISQINQRATGAIEEFQQVWNYDNGVSNGELSKDWVFVKSSDIDNSSSYQISSTFPTDDMMGYSRFRVPAVPFITDLNVSDFDGNGSICPQIVEEGIVGIMLGDIDGSYQFQQPDGSIRGEVIPGDSLFFDLSNSTFDDNGIDFFVNIPVILESVSANINAIDFWMQFDENRLEFTSASLETSNADVFTNYDIASQTLRLTSSGDDINTYFVENTQVYTLRFKLIDPCQVISEDDFIAINVLFNGVSGNWKMSQSPEFEGASIEVSAQDVYCAGEEISFNLVGGYQGHSFEGFEWSFGNGQESSEDIGSVVYASSGDYVVNVTGISEAGCLAFFSLPIEINPSPVVSFTGVTSGGLVVSFTNNSSITAGSIASYEWNFGDGNTSEDNAPTHNYSAFGDYNVVLTAISDLGCTASISSNIEVINSIAELELFGVSIYPNPSNGIFTIQGGENLHARIFDSTGRVVVDNILITNGLKSLVNISHLAAGNYQLLLSDGTKYIMTQIVVMP
ncbi:MAG: Ig-like domain-containing protein [Flavobacteriales bacterium]|jgi:chitodextrinase